MMTKISKKFFLNVFAIAAVCAGGFALAFFAAPAANATVTIEQEDGEEDSVCCEYAGFTGMMYEYMLLEQCENMNEGQETDPCNCDKDNAGEGDV